MNPLPVHSSSSFCPACGTFQFGGTGQFVPNPVLSRVRDFSYHCGHCTKIIGRSFVLSRVREFSESYRHDLAAINVLSRVRDFSV